MAGLWSGLEGWTKFVILGGATTGVFVQVPGGTWFLAVLLAAGFLWAGLVAAFRSRLPLLALAFFIRASAAFLVVPIGRMESARDLAPFALAFGFAWIVSAVLSAIEERRSRILREALASRSRSLGEIVSFSWLPESSGTG